MFAIAHQGEGWIDYLFSILYPDRKVGIKAGQRQDYLQSKSKALTTEDTEIHGRFWGF